MKTKLMSFLMIAFSLPLFAVEKSEPSLCKEGEVAVFNCRIKKKIASVCASKSTDAKERFMQYRFGTSAKLELAIPEKGIEGIKVGNMMYSGGGGIFISFTDSNADYVIYSKTMKQGEDSGVYVEKSGKKVANHKCRPVTEMHMSSKKVIQYGITKIDDPGYDL